MKSEVSAYSPAVITEQLDRTTDALPRVTVIVPCRNEARFIARCLESIVRNDYPQDRLELIVVDGMSEDETCSIVGAVAREHPCVVRLLNTKKITPAALNLGITHASGEIIIRVDAHARVAEDYIRLSVAALFAYGADNAGGAMETLPARDGRIATAIAACMSHPFGVGNSAFRARAGKVVFTDTVFGGCYRREVFERIGLFNESLARTQDMEFNQRLRKAGGRIVLDPRIKCFYYASPDIKSFARHNFHDGAWAILPFAHSNVVPVRWRHLVPAAFLAAILVSMFLGIWFIFFRMLLAGIVGVYAAASFASSVHIARHLRGFRYALLMLLVFGARHFAYGLGSICAVIKLACNRALIRNVFWRAKARPA